MKENLYLPLFAGILTLSLVTLYIGKIIFVKSSFYKLQRIFIMFIVLHSFNEAFMIDFFLLSHDIAAPFFLFYAPFFYNIGLVGVLRREVRFGQLFPHFFLGFFFLSISILFSSECQLLELYSCYYLRLLYFITCLQLFFYGILTYVTFNKTAKDIKMITFINESILVMITGVLMFFDLFFSDHLENDRKILMYVFMFLAMIIIFRLNCYFLYKKLNSNVMKLWKEPINENKSINIKKEKYYKTKLSDEVIKSYIDDVENALANKIYLRSDLTLNDLSKELKIPAYHLSQVFSKGLNSNFNNTVNSYRIQHALMLLNDPNNKDTIEQKGIDSGFSSRVSFYRAFNLICNTTPSVYLKNNILE